MRHETRIRLTHFFVACASALALGLALWWLSPHTQLANEAAYAATRVEGEIFPKLLHDPSGVVLSIASPPHRIVSVVLAADEFLAALTAPERVAGVTYIVDDPTVSNIVGHYSATLPRTSTNVEALLAIDPDLVIVAPFTQPDTIAQLLAAKVPVLRLEENDSFDQIFANLRRVGAVLGEDSRSRAIETHARARIEAIRTRTQNAVRPRVLVLGANGYTVGRHTLSDEVIEIAGGTNALREAGFEGDAQISEELAISLAPDVILLEKDSDGLYGDPIAALLHKPAWQNVPAVRNRRVYAHNTAWSAAVSHFRVRDAEEVAALLHPELFTETTP